jgi:hypothetical protein
MAYATKELVQADFKDTTFTATTNVKPEDVTQFIVEADALIDAYVGKRYTVPVTSGSSLELLKLFSRSLVAARIKRIMEVKQDKNTDANQSVVGVLFSPTMVIKMLTEIRDGEMSLAGALALDSGGGFYNANVANEVEAVVKKDETQW